MASAAKAKSMETAQIGKDKGLQLARDPKVQVTVASAAGGATVVGAGGAGAGLLAGGVAGAAVGVLPALFTFGLSIPVGAAIGGGCGTHVGAAAGGSAGFVGGATLGYGVYTKRSEIRNLAHGVRNRVGAVSRKTGKTVKNQAGIARQRIADTCSMVKQ